MIRRADPLHFRFFIVMTSVDRTEMRKINANRKRAAYTLLPYMGAAYTLLP